MRKLRICDSVRPAGIVVRYLGSGRMSSSGAPAAVRSAAIVRRVRSCRLSTCTSDFPRVLAVVLGLVAEQIFSHSSGRFKSSLYSLFSMAAYSPANHMTACSAWNAATCRFSRRSLFVAKHSCLASWTGSRSGDLLEFLAITLDESISGRIVQLASWSCLQQ